MFGPQVNVVSRGPMGRVVYGLDGHVHGIQRHLPSPPTLTHLERAWVPTGISLSRLDVEVVDMCLVVLEHDGQQVTPTQTFLFNLESVICVLAYLAKRQFPQQSSYQFKEMMTFGHSGRVKELKIPMHRDIEVIIDALNCGWAVVFNNRSTNIL